jgi:hypothetical protein
VFEADHFGDRTIAAEAVMRQSEPTGSGKSAASMVRPLMPCTCPTTRKGIAVRTASSWASGEASKRLKADDLRALGHQFGDDAIDLAVEIAIDFTLRR